MRRAFSLVEMTIVLIVMGIILGIIMAGTNFINTAQIRAELNKLNKFATAISSFYAENSQMPPVVVTGVSIPQSIPPNVQFFDIKDLVDFGISNDDFKSKFSSETGNGYFIAGCWVDANGYSLGASNNTLSPTACVYMSNFQDYFICNLEHMADDNNTHTGEGRRWDTADPMTNLWVPGCDVPQLFDPTNARNYGFRVFRH